MRALVTAGIGDFIAVESVLRPEERPETIFWASRVEASLKPLAAMCFPGLKEEISLFSAFTGPRTRFFCFDSKEDLQGKTGLHLDPDILDLNVVRIGEQYLKGERAFQGSSLLKHQLADISRFGLPRAYCVIHPYSENVPEPLRDLSLVEWDRTREWLKQMGLHGVVVNKGSHPAPAGFIDLTNKTTLLEALEITKGACAFVGCSSAMSVVAGQVVGPEKFWVKGHHVLRDEWHRFYYPLAPGRVFGEITFEGSKSLIEQCICGALRAASEKHYELPMLRCTMCGVLRQDVRLTPSGYQEWYRDKYFDGVYTHSDSHDREVARIRLDSYGLRKGVRLLDVGCGNGAFVEEARKRGLDAWGQDLAHQSNGPHVYAKELAGVSFPTGHFSVVTIHDVLEHVPNPREFLREVRRILAPGGTLIVDFPRFHHPSGVHHWKPTEHLWMLEDGDVAALLGSEGFVVKELLHPIPSKSVFIGKALALPKPVRILVPGGIGDSYWVMVKLRGWLEQRGISLPEVWVDDRGYHRSEGLWRRVPFIRWGGYAKINDPSRIKAYATPDHVVQEGVDGFDYFISLNGAMDAGLSVEQAMPGPTNWYEPMFVSKEEEELQARYQREWGDYIVVAFWGKGMYLTWLDLFNEQNILTTLRGLAAQGKKIIVMGAEWDKGDIGARLASKDKRFVNLVGHTSFDGLTALLRGASGVMGFPAGNTLLGPYLRRPTMLMWNHKFPKPFWRNCVPADVGQRYLPLELKKSLRPEEVVREMLALMRGDPPGVRVDWTEAPLRVVEPEPIPTMAPVKRLPPRPAKAVSGISQSRSLRPAPKPTERGPIAGRHRHPMRKRS